MCIYNAVIGMGTTIAVNDTTRSKLERLKREGESFDDVVNRLIGDAEPIESGFFEEGEAEELMDIIREHREDTRVS